MSARRLVRAHRRGLGAANALGDDRLKTLWTFTIWMGALGLTYVAVRAVMGQVAKGVEQTGSALCPGLISGIPTGAPSITLYKPVAAAWGSGYGMRVLRGVANCHNGQDFSAASGTEIHVAGSGTVTKVWTDDLNGNAIFIDHGGGWGTGYAHMVTPAFVGVGARVYTGQVIGKVGSTGNSTGPHLHLSVFYRGQAVDPKLVVRDALASPAIA